MKIEVNQPTLEGLFKDFYAVPAFQREYVWGEANVTALLDDIRDALYDERGSVIESEYFIGSLVVYPDENKIYQLIDGQQRTTTLFIVLCAIKDALLSIDSAQDLSDLDAMLLVKRRDPSSGALKAQFRVTPLYADANDMLARIGSGMGADFVDERKLSKSAKNMREAYLAARDFLTVFDTSSKELLRFFSLLSTKVRLVRIETPGISDALRIFETINDRGVGLNAMDLLKNLLFMQAGSSEYEQLTSIWKEMIRVIEGGKVREKPLRFLRYYLLSRYADARRAAKPLTEDDLYAWLEERKGRPDIAIETKPLQFAKDLRDAALEYERFVVSPPPALSHIARLSARARQHMVVMLASAGLTSEELTYLTSRLEALFVAYLLTRQATKALDLIFANAAPKLRDLIQQSKPSEERRKELEAFVDSWVNPEIHKLYDRLHNAFMTLSLDQKTKTRFVLARVSMHLDEVAGKRQLSIHDYWDYHIEHILPNSPSDEQRQDFDLPNDYDLHKQKLGNLTLLEQSINSSIGRDYYSDKKSAYSKSDVFMTRALVESQGLGGQGRMDQAGKKLTSHDSWTSRSISKRHAELIALAYGLWRFPVL